MKLRILKGLGVCFTKVRILPEITGDKLERWKVRRLWKEDKERELNAETQSAQRSEDEGTGTDLKEKAKLALRGSGQAA